MGEMKISVMLNIFSKELEILIAQLFTDDAGTR